jgi:hypothetical protein
MADRTDGVWVSRGAEGQQSVSVSTSSAQTTSALTGNDPLVYATVECFVVAGTNPTASVATGTPIPAAGYVRLLGVQPGDKLAFITASGTGTVYVCPDK